MLPCWRSFDPFAEKMWISGASWLSSAAASPHCPPRLPQPLPMSLPLQLAVVSPLLMMLPWLALRMRP